MKNKLTSENTYTTIRVTRDTARNLEQIAALLTIHKGAKQFADDAAEFAAELARRKLETKANRTSQKAVTA